MPLAVPGIRIIPHVCNNVGSWGAGFSGKLSRIDPTPEQAYRQAMRTDPPARLGYVQFTQIGHHSLVIANMIAQDGIDGHANPMMKPRRPQLRYLPLLECMSMVAHYAHYTRNCDHFKNSTIHCPKFGSALAGGHWPTIESLILEIWVDRGIDVFVYDYEPNMQHWNIIDTFEVPTLPN